MAEPLRVNLRAIVEEDRDRLRSWRNEPDVRRWMYTDHEIAQSEHAAWFTRLLAEPRPRHWIIEAETVPMGLVNLYDLDAVNGRGSWAYYIGEQSGRGRGLGAAVEYLAIERAFGEFALHKLWCEVLADNDAVVRLHESFGFTREALFRDHVVKYGRHTDVVGMGLLAREWADRREDSLARLIKKRVLPQTA